MQTLKLQEPHLLGIYSYPKFHELPFQLVQVNSQGAMWSAFTWRSHALKELQWTATYKTHPQVDFFGDGPLHLHAFPLLPIAILVGFYASATSDKQHHQMPAQCFTNMWGHLDIPVLGFNWFSPNKSCALTVSTDTCAMSDNT